MHKILFFILSVVSVTGCGLNEDIKNANDTIDSHLKKIDSFKNTMRNYDSLIQIFNDSHERKNKYVDTIYIK